MESAGDVVIQITASTAAFEAALARARTQATAFDAELSGKLSSGALSAGLAKIAGLIETNNQLLSKMVGTASPAAASLEKVSAATKGATAALESFNLAQMETKANFTVMGASMQQYEAMLVEVNAANRIGVELEKQKATLTQGAVGALNSQAGAARTVASETEHVATASRLGATQMMSLAHAGRSAAEGLVLGVPTMQILAQQANHLSYALAGEEGLIAATAKARAAFVGWLGTTTGVVTTAGVAAVAGLTAYVLATRNSIQSVDQVLSEHKALIDEIAAAYPEAAKAAKQYEEVAAKLPQSVAAADINDKIKENTKTLDDLLGSLATRAQMLSQEWGLVGSAGEKAFGDIADIAKSGAVDAADRVQAALGRMRMDPALNDTAQEFAKSLQNDATQAAKLQDALNAKGSLKGIVDDNARAKQTLFDIAGGLDTVKASAGGADTSISKMFGALNGGGGGQFGVERSLQSTLAMFQQVDTAVQDARRGQLTTFLDLDNQLRTTTEQADALKQAITSAATGDNVKLFFGDVSGIANANSELQRSVDTVNRLFDAMNTGNATTRSVFEGIDMIRQTLIRDGFGVDAVNRFVDSLVKTRMQLDQDTAGARQLNAAIQAIKNRTVTITVVTRKVGTGTQSLYDVPSSNGGTGSVGVTRYGGDGSAGASMNAYSVPSEGGSYGSQGGSGGSGNSTVNVTRYSSTGPWENPNGATANEWSQLSAQDKEDIYWGKTDYAHILYPDYYRAGGGPVTANTPYWVGEQGPELVVPSGNGTVIPNAQSVALAQQLGNAQSGFTGREATAEQDRIWTVLMNIEANTRKTSELLDDIKIASASSGSAFSGTSYGGSSGGVDTSEQDQLSAQYMNVLRQVQANFKAAGIIGRGIIGYGLDGLAASPQEIARNIVYGGASPVGFATGGMIHPGDSQEVRFFKSPEETVAIFTPAQMQALRGENQNQSTQAAADQRPISVSLSFHLQSGAQVSNDSVAEIRRQTALAVRDAMRSINGR
ncbi:hypothetical protein MPLA_140347 [Mesorhizobium sp. ORS 3359]|nr:hypothetical protein MPLA_140347 [Mesorhizobium sp. ORS 3359]